MTSLPKRGDRVRVTWAHQHSSLKVGSEVVLSSHGYAVDPANELYRPTPPPDCVSFMYADADHRERGSHAVKVEILERAGNKASTAHVLGHHCNVCSGPCRAAIPNGPHPPPVVSIDAALRAEFVRGMRRAVEIADRLQDSQGGMVFRLFDLAKLKEAIEKELAK